MGEVDHECIHMYLIYTISEKAFGGMALAMVVCGTLCVI